MAIDPGNPPSSKSFGGHSHSGTIEILIIIRSYMDYIFNIWFLDLGQYMDNLDYMAHITI